MLRARDTPSAHRAYTAEHGITPQTIMKAIRRGIEQELAGQRTVRGAAGPFREKTFDRDELLIELAATMLDSAQSLEFEKAAHLRDEIAKLKALPAGTAVAKPDAEKPRKAKPGMPGTRAGRKGKGGRR